MTPFLRCAARSFPLSLALAAPTFAQAPRVVATIQLPTTHTLTGVLAIDVDGDGIGDLVLACRDAATKRRELRLHRGRAAADGSPAFANEPSLPPLPIERDVVAFTFVDATAAPGRELVLLTPERAVAVAWPTAGAADGGPTDAGAADAGPRYTPLTEHRSVWPAADPDFVLPLADVRCDFDGDGHDDLLLPVPDGALLQSLHVPTRRHTLTLPPRRSPTAKSANGGASLQDGQLSLSLATGDGDDDDAAKGPLVRLRTRTPVARLQDLDGDGTQELVAVRNDQLFVGRLLADRLAGDRPGAADLVAAGSDAAGFTVTTRALPVPEDRLTLFDPTFDVQLVDVDGDRRLDLVLTTSARRDDAIEVRIDLFRTAADGSWAKKPDARLRLQTLARPPQLVDADGDGRLDLVALSLRTESLRDPTRASPEALEAQLLVFRGDGTRFVQPAALGELLRLPVTAGRASFAEVLPGTTAAPGALLLAVDDTLVRRPLRSDGDRLRLAPPTTTLPVPADAQLQFDEASGDVLVRTGHELLVVRTR